MQPDSSSRGPRKPSEGSAKESDAIEFESFGLNAAYVDEIRDRYRIDPDAVDTDWAVQFGDPPRAHERPVVPQRSAGEGQQKDRYREPAQGHERHG